MSSGKLNYSGSYSSSFNLILFIYGFTTRPAVGLRKMLISIQSGICIISHLTKEEREKGISYALPDS